MKTRIIPFVFLLGATALAGPSRPIQSSTFSVQTPCGPAHDPYAQQGQWFLNLGTGATTVNGREYHDEDNTLSIAGVVQNITFQIPANPLSNIMAFDILVTVSNTLPSAYQYGSSSNSHNEVQNAPMVTAGGSTMNDVRIAAEFAIPNLGVVPSGIPPYWLDPFSGGQYYIVAANEDEHAWYCWDPNQQTPQYQPAGAYQVPAWNLTPSTIPPGGTAAVLMQFTVTGAGLPYSGGALGTDYRHGVIRASRDFGWDVLYNRYPSLKISHWLDTIVIDNGVTLTTPPYPYWDGEPVEYIHASDASVFYNDSEGEEYPHKMHWPQLPDPNGWDVRACSVPPTDPDPDGLRKVLADDFRCTSNGYINHITFWGSWFSNVFNEAASYQGITNMHLSIHSDIPAGELAQWSMPQVPALWQIDFNPSAPPAGWVIPPPQEEVPSLQGWYDPNTGMWQTNNHTRYFRYEFILPNGMAFEQVEGMIYWLDISVDTEVGLWGWKTSVSPHFNDDAVWADLPVTNHNQWHELRDPLTGESLDLAFIIDEYEPEIDWGDAPDSLQIPGYPTLSANNGANHTIIPGAYLGAGVDGEPDGQPDPQALGDDNDILYPPPNDDEDGVSWSQLVPGLSATLTVTASVSGFLDAWIDYNANGNWTDPGEQILGGSIPLNAGLNVINFMVPASATPTLSTFGRFRFSLAGGLSPTGSAPDGEVEDYAVSIDDPIDWGDAPDPTYPTLSASGGAAHLIGGPFLGLAVDPELDGQPSALADGDDLDSQGDDEDGITFLNPIIPGAVAQVGMLLGGVPPASLDAWIDFNADGFWGAGEQIFSGTALAPGNNLLFFPVPAGAIPSTNTFARFRVSSSGGLSPTGYAQDGEVEDYMVFVDAARDIDWGDAPGWLGAPYYPTLMAHNGAHHAILSGMFLGNQVDSEPDGQPANSSDGDDLDSLYPSLGDDEDGVILTSRLMPGGFATVDVIASIAGVLDAWIDFGNDGSWAQAGDRIFAGQPLVAGTNSLTFPVPLTAAQKNSAYSRFRFSSGGVASYTGLALDGEVEDHEYMITPIESGGIDRGDAPDGYQTLNASGGPSHAIVPGVMLGATIDPEPDGQPDPSAMGDDANNLDDEDGITFLSKIVAGSNASVRVVAGVSGGRLDAWIDFNADGDWLDAGEQIITSQPVGAGVNNLSFSAPQPIMLGPTFARFRLSSTGGLGTGGAASDGEVEDYAVELYQSVPVPGIEITNLFFSVSNTVATIEWNAQTNITYQVQSSTNLTTNVWTDVGGWLLGPVNWQTNSAAPDAQFYRVTAPWTP